MAQTVNHDRPDFLTTKEVAALLRVKERKVYDLAAAGEIPHRRLTGKLLFPRAEIAAWVESGQTRPAPAAAPVLAGSHDPLLDWAVREAGADLAMMVNGSFAGLETFAQGQAAVTGLHVIEAGGWNLQTVAARGLTDCVLLGWAERTRGLLLPPGGAGGVTAFAQVRGRRVVPRQPGSGAAVLFDRLLAEAGMAAADLAPAGPVARTESDAAAAVLAGEADAALGIEAMARQFHLDFLPLTRERFDLLVDRRAYFTDPVQTLFGFLRSATFRDKAHAMGGYDLSETGKVRWLSP